MSKSNFSEIKVTESWEAESDPESWLKFYGELAWPSVKPDKASCLFGFSTFLWLESWHLAELISITWSGQHVVLICILLQAHVRPEIRVSVKQFGRQWERGGGSDRPA